MDVDGFTKVVAAVVSLIQALGWPLIVLLLIVRFGRPLYKFLDDVSEFSLKAGATGIEASAKSRQLEAAALLGIANGAKQKETANQGRGTLSEAGEAAMDLQDDSAGTSISWGGLSIGSPEETARHIANVVSNSVTPRSIRRLADAFALWVDNHPENNVYERQALEALGIRFAISTSTQDALQKLQRNTYDVIISDMSRESDKTAGYTLIREARKQGISTPVIIYGGLATAVDRAEAQTHGAFARTNNPQELLQLVNTALIKSQR